jgi:hypothetical protein
MAVFGYVLSGGDSVHRNGFTGVILMIKVPFCLVIRILWRWLRESSILQWSLLGMGSKMRSLV